MPAKYRINITLLLVALSALSCLAFSPAESKNMKKAKEFFAEGKFNEALAIYDGIMRANPDSDIANFNVGLVLYKKKEFIKSIENFTKALVTENKAVEHDALLFIGNAYFMLAEDAEKLNETLAAKTFKEALGYYARAMELDENDKAARYNYELAAKRLYYLAEGILGKASDMLRASIPVLMMDEKARAEARERDMRRRDEDRRTEIFRREEDRSRYEARMRDDRALGLERRKEDEAALSGAATPEAAATVRSQLSRREAARRAEDAEREAKAYAEDEATEKARSKEDADRESRRRAEDSQAKPAKAQGEVVRLFDMSVAWADEATEAPAAAGGAASLYEKRRTEDAAIDSSRRLDDDSRQAKRRTDDISEDSTRRSDDAKSLLDLAAVSQAQDEATRSELKKRLEEQKAATALDREKNDRIKELARVEEDRMIIITREKEDIERMMARAKEDADAARQRKEELEQKSLVSEGKDAQAISALAAAAGREADSLEQKIESLKASIDQENMRMKSDSSRSQKLNADVAVGTATTGGVEISRQITGQLSKGGKPSPAGGTPPKLEKSVLEQLEDELAKRAKEESGAKEKEEPAKEEALPDKNAELLIETYWEGEAPKKIIEREKSPEYRKDEKGW